MWAVDWLLHEQRASHSESPRTSCMPHSQGVPSSLSGGFKQAIKGPWQSTCQCWGSWKPLFSPWEVVSWQAVLLGPMAASFTWGAVMNRSTGQLRILARTQFGHRWRWEGCSGLALSLAARAIPGLFPPVTIVSAAALWKQLLMPHLTLTLHFLEASDSLGSSQ